LTKGFMSSTNMNSSEKIKLSNTTSLFDNLVSPKNHLKKEVNYHSKYTKNYESTLSFIQNTKNNKPSSQSSSIYKKFKSVLNDFYDVPAETKINNAKFKIGCICPEMFEQSTKLDLKSKLNATKFELFRPTNSLSPSKKNNDKNIFPRTKQSEYNFTNQSNNQKEDDVEIKEKLERLKMTERSSKFASPNVTVKTETNNNNMYVSPKSSSSFSTNLFTPSTNSNRYFSSTDRKLFALAGNKNLSESLGLKKKDSNKNLYSVSVNMNKIPQSFASKIEKNFPDFVQKNKSQDQKVNINFNDYHNRIKIRNMKEKVQKLINN